jgi:hypothetical protein
VKGLSAQQDNATIIHRNNPLIRSYRDSRHWNRAQKGLDSIGLHWGMFLFYDL